MGTEYIFATALINSEERNLLKEEQFRVMTESGNIDDICKTLQDAGYGNETESIRPGNYEKILKEKEAELFAEIDSLSNENPIFKIFAFPSDYHNIKTLLKAEFLGVDRGDILLATGSITPAKMTELVRERDRSLLTEYMFRAIEEAVDNHARTKDPQAVDFICDKYCFQDIAKVAEECKNDFVKGYVKLWIDTANLKTFVRVKKMGQPWGYYSDTFIPGGNVDIKTYVSGYDEEPAQFAARFESYEIKDAVALGREEIAKSGTFTLLEKLCDDALIEYIRNAKGITFGIEKLVAHLVAKQMEIKCVRILMSGKLADMDPQAIRERLRVTYE